MRDHDGLLTAVGIWMVVILVIIAGSLLGVLAAMVARTILY